MADWMKGASKPKPFVRPSIDLGGNGPRKVWQKLPASAVVCGDIVADVGLVHATGVLEGQTVLLAGDSEDTSTRSSHAPDEILHVFGLPR